MAAGMATGEAWFKVPSAIKFVLNGKLKDCCSGKDVILHIIGMIGVDGALYKTLEICQRDVLNGKKKLPKSPVPFGNFGN